MTAPTICGQQRERVVDWLEWRFGTWVLATREGIGYAHYRHGDGEVKTTMILVHNYGSDAEAAAGLESWLRLMVSTTCEPMGLEVRERGR